MCAQIMSLINLWKDEKMLGKALNLKEYAHKSYLSFQKRLTFFKKFYKNRCKQFRRYGHLCISQCFSMAANILKMLSHDQN